MKYILIKTVKGANCDHRAVGARVREYAWTDITDLNQAHNLAQKYNNTFNKCGCRCAVKETE